MVTDAQRDILDKARRGLPITPEDVCRTIECEVELESYRAGLRLRGALTTDAMTAIEQRRFQLQRAKGVTWRT